MLWGFALFCVVASPFQSAHAQAAQSGSDPVLQANCGAFSFCDGSALSQVQQTIWKNYLAAMMVMTQEIDTTGKQHAQIIGSFFDAASQTSTQRALNLRLANAHKDYHPSDSVCQVGTFARSLAATDARATLNRIALSAALMSDLRAAVNSSTALGAGNDYENQVNQFRTTYCDPQDSNGGLNLLCQHDLKNPQITAGEKIGGQDKVRLNRDIDYPRLVDHQMTLDIDFSDATPTSDEADVLALARNLYWPRALETPRPESLEDQFGTYMKYDVYQDARSLFASVNVAMDSLGAIAGMKSRSASAGAQTSSGPFMKALLVTLGYNSKEVDNVIGTYPSYYAQMEMLTRTALQNPAFYTNLYDKPANVKRMSVGLSAIGLMQLRDRYESSLRREMLLSQLVEQALTDQAARVNATLQNIEIKVQSE
jgi:hypothetical protein